MFNDLLLDHVGLPHVLDLAVHLVNFFGWMSQGDHHETLLLWALFYQSTPSCWKVMGGVGWWWWPMGFQCEPLVRTLDLDSDLDQGLIIKIWLMFMNRSYKIMQWVIHHPSTTIPHILERHNTNQIPNHTPISLACIEIRMSSIAINVLREGRTCFVCFLERIVILLVGATGGWSPLPSV